MRWVQVEVFCVIAPRSVVVGYQRFRGHPEDGGSMVLWNFGILLQHYTASQPKTSRLGRRDLV